MTIRELLTSAEAQAARSNKEESAVKLLLQHITKKESYQLVVELDEEIPHEQQLEFETALSRYINENIPIQHIIGYETFFGYEFVVNEDVLIPRFETEELVAKVLELYDIHFDGQAVDVVDIGTGCGAIGITLALEESNMNVAISDISEAALAVAQKNSDRLGANVTAVQSDMLNYFIENGKKFDILVSNPPYIPAQEAVDPLVYDNEPHLALFGGDDGLFFYRRILQDAAKILKHPNFIAFEHAYHHREGMAKLIETYFPASEYETIKDMQGRDRITVIINK